ncbi:unnamed protein product [Amaranthus hypochondriacus]
MDTLSTLSGSMLLSLMRAATVSGSEAFWDRNPRLWWRRLSSGNEVIIHSEVWDLQKFRLLRSVPSLE